MIKNMKTGWHILLVTCISMAWVTLACAARVDQDVLDFVAAHPKTHVPVLVQFEKTLDIGPFKSFPSRGNRAELVPALKGLAQKSQGALRAFLGKQGIRARELWIRNALAARIPEDVLQTIESWPGVAEVMLDATVQAPITQPALAPVSPDWNLDMIGAPRAWAEGFDGTGVTVAVLDSGVFAEHPELSGSWKGNPGGWYNPLADECISSACSACDASTELPCDFVNDIGLAHGTAVTSLITGETVGVAPAAKWIGVKIFGEQVATNNSSIIDAFQWLVDLDDPPDIVNNSWGFEGSPDQCFAIFQNEIQVLQAAGIHVVFAAGNTGSEASTSVGPANLPEGLAVGVVDSEQVISEISARGPGACSGSIYDDLVVDVYPEIVAPGESVLAAGVSMTQSPEYLYIAGTSASASHVSGSLALLNSAVDLPRMTLEMALLDTAVDRGDVGPDNTYGRGLVNVPAALHMVRYPPVPVLFDPGDEASGLEQPIRFSWYQGPDPNGDPLVTTLILSKSSSFVNPMEIPVSEQSTALMLLGSGLGVTVLFMRRGRFWLFFAAGMFCLWLISCGGGDGDIFSSEPLEPNTVFILDSPTLDAGTTYYWKVRVNDPEGHVVESSSRSFATN